MVFGIIAGTNFEHRHRNIWRDGTLQYSEP